MKKDGRREAFSKLKLLTGIQAACQKRPISLAQMEQLVDRIVKQVLDHPGKDVTSDEMGKMVMAGLKDLDDVAFVRFASVYRNFDDIKEFIETLQKEQTYNSNESANSDISI